jgi:hypothetical protein
MSLRKAIGVVAVCLLVAAPAMAFVPRVLYSDIASSPTSDVPGLSGAKFSSFDRPYRSPDGNYWIFSADTDLSTSMDEVIVRGMGLTGTVMVQEGTPTGFGDNFGLIDRNMGINDSGQFAFATNTDGATTSDEVIVMYDGSAFAAAAREGDALPAPFGTEFYGTTLNSPSITNAGEVAFRAPSTTGTLGSDFNDFLIFNNAVLAQEGTTSPNGTTETWDGFDTQDFYVNGDGTAWLAQGDLTGDTTRDDVLVWNSDIVIQEGSAFGGMSSPAETIVEPLLMSNGSWMARGDNDDQTDWVVLDGAVLAQTGDAVPGGEPGETFSDALYSATFFGMAANNVGDFIYAGTTSNPDVDKDAVVVVNNSFVLLRQGDAVDLDGDGQLNDDAYIDIFNNEDSFLTDDGWFYFTADLRDGSGAGIGQAFLRVAIPEPASLVLLVLAGLALRRR